MTRMVTVVVVARVAGPFAAIVFLDVIFIDIPVVVLVVVVIVLLVLAGGVVVILVIIVTVCVAAAVVVVVRVLAGVGRVGAALVDRDFEGAGAGPAAVVGHAASDIGDTRGEVATGLNLLVAHFARDDRVGAETASIRDQGSLPGDEGAGRCAAAAGSNRRAGDDGRSSIPNSKPLDIAATTAQIVDSINGAVGAGAGLSTENAASINTSRSER